MILLIDNYDSFTFNLQRYLRQFKQDVVVVRNDDACLTGDLTRLASTLVISPGPKGPADAGYCLDVVREWSGRMPILGVCLGHQVIYEAWGGRVVRAEKPMHARMSSIQISTSRLFDGIPSGAHFARYHSLVACPDEVPEWLSVTAWSETGEIMAIEHKEHPTFGVQFHPESILSLHGHLLLRNFLSVAGAVVPEELPSSDLKQPKHVASPPKLLSLTDAEPVLLPPASKLLLSKYGQ